MSRCKCGKKLTQAELNYKDPATDSYLDYCFECMESSFIDDDVVESEELHVSLDDIVDDVPVEDHDTLIQDISDLT